MNTINSVIKNNRIENIDMLRGFVIVLMALDHVRYFFSLAEFDPLDISRTNIFWFFTRWITHICAPSFILLAGMGIGFSKRSEKNQALFLIKRGLWLILLEVSIVNIFWGANITTGNIYLGVLWALGVSMLFMGFGIFLDKKIVLLISLILIFGHNLLDSYDNYLVNSIGVSWNLIHKKGLFELMGLKIHVVYPVVPWVGLMGIGYLMGKWNLLHLNQKLYIKMSMVLFTLFILLRFGNFYGDSYQWKIYDENLIKNIFSFLNVSKYPPSLHYLLITIGIACTLLYFLRNLGGYAAFILRTFGRAPLFFYILHIPFIHLFAIIWAYFGYGQQLTWSFHRGQIPKQVIQSNLTSVYLAWTISIILLFPIIKKFEKFKSNNKFWWLSYL